MIFLLISGACVFFVYQNQKLQKEVKMLKNTASLSQEEAKQLTQELVKEVGKLIALPTDEDPTLATILDVEKLKGQPFFVNAINGDRVLVYTKARKAYLYRPTEQRLIEVGALTEADPANQELLAQQGNTQPNVTPATVSPTSEPLGQVTVAIRNTTADETRVGTLEQFIKQQISGAIVSERGLSTTKGISGTVLYDVRGNQAVRAQQVAKTLSARYGGTLPATETTTPAEFLILIGVEE